MRSPDTLEYMKELARSADCAELELVKVVPGNRFVPGRGTWAHPRLAVFFARWLSKRLARTGQYRCATYQAQPSSATKIVSGQQLTVNGQQSDTKRRNTLILLMGMVRFLGLEPQSIDLKRVYNQILVWKYLRR